MCNTHPAHQHRIGSSVLLNDEKLIPDPASFGPVENLPFLPSPLPVSVQGQVTCKQHWLFYYLLFWVTVCKNKFNITAQFVLQIQKRVWVGDLISGEDHFCIRGCQFKSSRENVDGWMAWETLRVVSLNGFHDRKFINNLRASWKMMGKTEQVILL